MELICAEEVCETEQPEEKTILAEVEEGLSEDKKDFQVSKSLTVVLEDVFDLTTGGMEMHGFKKYDLVHPTKDYDVS